MAKDKRPEIKIDNDAFYEALSEFGTALDDEIARLGETTVSCPLKRTKAKNKIHDLLVLTGKKVAKLQKTYEGDPTPDIFPNEEGGSD